MTTTRELNADELSIASGGGINMGSLAAIAAAPRLLSMFNVAWPPPSRTTRHPASATTTTTVGIVPSSNQAARRLKASTNSPELGVRAPVIPASHTFEILRCEILRASTQRYEDDKLQQ